ncbi:MAG: hypothetical protein RL490_119 [Pseudomonadota bacterium]|jgi:hypothetical protein
MPRPIPEAIVGRNEISDAAHAVLDLLDANHQEWADIWTWHGQINRAAKLAFDANHQAEFDMLGAARTRAVEAAARLIHAIGEIDRCIAAGIAAGEA